jgi:hypothetical protein
MKISPRWVLLGLLVLLMGPAAVAAQSAVGFRAGGRFAALDTAHEADGVAHLALAGYFGLGLSDHVALQLEVVYGGRGAESLVLVPEVGPATLGMTYLDIPFLLRVGFPGRRFLPSVFAGPYAGFLLSCDLERDGLTQDCDGGTAGFRARDTEAGLLGGVALDMLVGQGTVFIDARYSFGLLGIAGGDQILDARHTGLDLSVGFAFPLGR